MRSALRIAFAETAQHPWRTLLVAQGMIWGVTLAVVPAAVIEGSREQAVVRARELGTDLIQVAFEESPGQETAPQENDLPRIRERLGDAATLSAMRVEAARAPRLDGERPSERWWILGTDAAIFEVRNTRFLEGRAPRARASTAPPAEVEAVLEVTLAERLAPAGVVVGSRLYLERPASGSPAFRLDRPPPEVANGLTLRIVGIVDDETERATDRFGYEKGRVFTDLARNLLRQLGLYPPDTPWLDSGLGIYVPRSRVPGDRLDWILARTDPLAVREVSAVIEEVLIERGRAPLIYTNALLPILTAPELDGYLQLHDVLFGVFVGIGWLVLANLLLLTGWRRRREVALRRTEGASRGSVFAQFLWEGVLVAVTGVFVGFPLGMAIAELRVSLDPNVVMSVKWPWGTGFRAGAILATGAVLASAYPAWRASGYHPMTLFRKGG